MADLLALKKESERLGREQADVEERLRTMDRHRSNRKYDSRRGGRGGNRSYGGIPHSSNQRKRGRDADIAETRPKQQPRIMSAIAAVVQPAHDHDDVGGSQYKDDDRWAPDMGEEAAKPAPQEAYLKPATVQRNRRMFSALMGHLDRAQKKLQVDSSIIEKQDSRKDLAAKKNREESIRVAAIQRTVSREQKEKELHLREVIMAKQEKMEIAIATAAWKAQQVKLEKYLLTSVEPRLAWLPGKPSDVTDAALTRRAEEVSEAVAQREADDEQKIALIDAKVEAKATKRKQEMEKDSRQVSEMEGGLEEEGVEADVKDEENGEERDVEQHEVGVDDGDDDDDILAALDGRTQNKKSHSDSENSDDKESGNDSDHIADN